MKRKGQQKRGVAIRKRKTRSHGRVGYYAYEISIPGEIADRIPPGCRFRVELTEDGILLRPVKPEPEKEKNTPKWLTDPTS